MSAPDPDIAGDARLHRGGRWAAILAACAAAPLTPAQLFDAVGRPDRPRKREKRKVRWAAMRLAEMGHLDRIHGGFRSAPAALELLAAAPPMPMPEPGDA